MPGLRRRPVDGATKSIVAINVAVFLLESLAGPRWQEVVFRFGLTADGLAHGDFWQLVTYQFLHGNELHILVNMLALWFAGRELERVLGPGRFVAVYLAGGIVAGLTQILAVPHGPPLIGASGSVCAVMLTLTTLFPRQPVTALLFFVLPLRMRARTLGLVLVAGSVLFWLSGWQPEVGHLAHLGGFAAGWGIGRLWRRRWGDPDDDFESEVEAGAPNFDAVLAKVMARGIESLSRAERRVLEEARTRRGRR